MNNHNSAVLADADADCNDIADPNEELRLAAEVGNATRVEVLLQCNGTNINYDSSIFSSKTPLYSASYYGHNKVVEVLLKDHRIDVNKGNGENSPLTIASSQGHLEIVEMLLRIQNLDINKG